MNAILNMMSSAKQYELPIARNYVKHWGMAEGVREIIQNAIDSDSPFEYEFGDDSLLVRSRYAILTASTLLLGATSKAENKDKIGSFGEGYKIALLVLLRDGYDVQVNNGDRTWTPGFVQSRQFGAEVLCIRDEAASRRVEGLEFVVRGLSPDDIAQVKESCLFMQDNIGALMTTSYGKILRERPGKLYVGGLYVCDTKMRFGYDMNPEHLSLERDRQTVNTFDLQFKAQKMWFETERWDEIAQLIESKCQDLEYAQHGAPELVKEACYQAFRAKHPEAVIAESHEEMKELVRTGITEVVVMSSGYAPIVRAAPSYQREMASMVRVPVVELPPADILAKWLSANRHSMRTPAIIAFKELVQQASKWHHK